MKRIKNNKMSKIHKADLIVFALILIIFISYYMSIGNNINFVKYEYIKSYYIIFYRLNLPIYCYISLTILLFFVQLFMLGLCSLFVLPIYLPIRNILVKKYKHSNMYVPVHDITYYREKLVGVTPAEISLLADLEIEGNKDISADILNLYQKGYLSFVNNTIVVNDNKDTSDLKESGKYLIRLIKYNNFNKGTIDGWKKICIEESIKDGYIYDKGFNIITYMIKDFLTGFVKIAVCVALLVFTCGIFLNVESTGKFMDYDKLADEMTTYVEEHNISEDDYETILADEYLSSNLRNMLIDGSKLIYIFIAICGLMFYIGYLMFGGFYKMFGKAIVASGDRYRRTNLGNEITERIAGLKNFIHDFSALDQKTKEEVILWEDFLVYAIILEENQSIVNDVLKMKMIDNNVYNSVSGMIK